MACCCEYVKRSGPALLNLLKRCGCFCEEKILRFSENLRKKFAPNYACPCELMACTFPEKSFSNRNSTTSESNSADTASVGSCRSSYGEPESQPWFFPIDRDEAELLLAKTGSGTFLVRRSGHGGPTNPYTLSIHYSGQIFHILVRKRPDGLLALGSQKSGESAFSTLTLLVETYMKEKLELQRSSRAVGTTRLIQWPQH